MFDMYRCVVNKTDAVELAIKWEYFSLLSHPYQELYFHFSCIEKLIECMESVDAEEMD